MDDSNVQKVWERPWSTEEMRAHCSSWNLAGDAGLLKHLQEFSQNLLQKTHTAQVALDSLLEDMRSTSVDVQNATNSLLMLSNNQFVENRVYDDCEDEKEEIEAKGDDDKTASTATKGSEESVLIAKAAEAILLGMTVIDTKFDCVEVPASDSEGEDDVQNAAHDDRKSFALVLEPRNPYALQPLPHLIGSKEFMEDDRVGLGGDEDDEEEEEEDDDVHLSIGQDLVAQGLNDSGSSLAGDMGDDGLFDEDEVEDRRGTKASIKQAWESSSSNGSDDLVVENNVIRKKLKKNKVAHDDEVEGDIFGGKASSSGDEFMAPTVHNTSEPPVMPRKPQKEEDFNDDMPTKPVAVNRKNNNGELSKKKTNAVKITTAVPKEKPKANNISSDNLFGPPKDEWKDDEDGDSIFAATDGIFSGGRGLFDDLEDPFMANDRRDKNRFQPPSLPDKPPAFKGGNDDTVMPQESKGDIFGDDDDEQDVFANIVAKVKSPQQKQGATQEEAPKKQHMPEKTQGKDLKGVGKEGPDSWLFDEDDQDDPLWDIDTTSKKGKKIREDGVGEQVVSKVAVASGPLQKEDKPEEETEAAAQPKLPVGARSFYAGGIDPFALGKKLTKELEDKRKIKHISGDDDSRQIDVNSNITAEAGDNPESNGGISEKKSVKETKPSPDSGSLFDGLDEGDDLFAPQNTKAKKLKDETSSIKDDLFEDSLFTSKKAPVISVKVDDTQKKWEKKISAGDVDNSKNLFGGFASDDDDDIFSSSNSLGSQSSTSKPLLNKDRKAFIDISDPLFDDGLGKDEGLFPGSLGKNILSEKEVEDDLFTGFTKKDERKSTSSKKKESSKSIKSEFKVPLSDGDKNDSSEDAGKVNQLNKTNSSDNLFGPLDVINSERNDSKPSKKTEASHFSKEIPTTHAKSKNVSDDIFGDADDKLSSVDVTKSVTGVPNIDTLSGVMRENGKVAGSKTNKKTEKLENLFDDFGSEDNNFLGSKQNVISKAVQPRATVFEGNSLAKKTDSKDLFSEFDSDGDDQKFSTPKGGKIKPDPLYFDDPLSQEDDLFSSLKPTVAKKTPTPSMLNDESLIFSIDSDRKKTEASTSKGGIQGSSKGDNIGFGEDHNPVNEDSGPQLLSGGSSTRKSPPKTLNLEKVIPSPKPDSKVVDLDDDFLGSNDAEDDKIVQAWMKGHPPPLRDSKVETAMEDDITPGYTPAQPYDDYGPSKNVDQESYFADLPSASLLRSHGKERARIQSHRRPPSRKIRKSSAASIDPLPVTIEDEVKPEPPMSAITLPSRDSMDEDGGSQGTIEEWSTPEAGLASPPRTLTTSVPPRSNPLSPSTDEEQDFFDVLPVGHYPPPPPMDQPSHLSPFPDALCGLEDVWDKDDGALFEDAQPMEQEGGGGLWGSSRPPATPGGETGWTPSEELSSKLGIESGARSLKEKPSVEEGGSGRKKDSDIFSKAGQGQVASSGTNESEPDSNLPKKTKKSQRKQESGKLDDDLWGNGFNSKLKDNIFAEDIESTRTGDFDDLFQGQGDLFGSSRVSTSTQETKKVTVGNVSEKSMGKSLSKLDSKSKAPVSLFDDDDDTEDLFSPHSSQPAPKKGSTTVKKTSSTRSALSEQPTKSTLLKVDANDSIFEDPLMVLKRKE